MTQDEKDRNARAAALVASPVFAEAVEYLKAAAVKALLSAPTPEEREEKWQEYRALDRVVETARIWAGRSNRNP